MPGGVDQIQHESFPIPRHIIESHGLRLDGDAAFAFQIHLIQQLVLHLAGGHRAGNLDQTVGERRFAMIDMGNDRKIANVGSLQVSAPFLVGSFPS